MGEHGGGTPPEPCIGRAIWDRCVAGADLDTAQGRAALDRRLRGELRAVKDRDLRYHSADVIRNLRALAFETARLRGAQPKVLRRLDAIEARLGWIEAKMRGEAPVQGPVQPPEPVEITRIRGGDR